MGFILIDIMITAPDSIGTKREQKCKGIFPKRMNKIRSLLFYLLMYNLKAHILIYQLQMKKVRWSI